MIINRKVETDGTERHVLEINLSRLRLQVQKKRQKGLREDTNIKRKTETKQKEFCDWIKKEWTRRLRKNRKKKGGKGKRD